MSVYGTNYDVWEECCKNFCRQRNFTLLFVNAGDFGYQTPEGGLVHMYADEMKDYLEAEAQVANGGC